jgi:O-succinylbenzoate synthase
MRVFRYALKSRGALNAVSVRRTFEGALVEVNGGVGCLHPWPEFGDEGVEDQLHILKNGGTTKVIERALRMAAVDGAARRAGVSLFEGQEVPLSHYSWDGNGDFDEQVERVLREGWRAVKTKGTKDLLGLVTWMERFANAAPGVQMRVDFNSCLSEADFVTWWGMLGEKVRGMVDFVEDGFGYQAGRWEAVRKACGVRLALDKALRGAVSGFDVAVLKPGRRDWRVMVSELPATVPVVLTSAMDHAIGQSFAAWEAACALRELGSRVDRCGLCTEHLFEQDAFFERMGSRGGVLTVDREGTGLGFDEVLRGLDWVNL